MVNYVSAIVFVFLLGPGLIVARALSGNPQRAVLFLVVWVLLDLFVAAAIRLAAEWERAVIFRLGKLSGVKGPGLFLIIPLVTGAHDRHARAGGGDLAPARSSPGTRARLRRRRAVLPRGRGRPGLTRCRTSVSRSSSTPRTSLGTWSAR